MKTNLLLLLVFVLFVACNGKIDNETADADFMPDVSLTEEEIENGILTPEMLWKFGRIGSADICPQSNTMVYNITYYSIEDNTGYTHIFTIPVEGGEPQRLTGGKTSYSNPRWTPEGDKIAYLTSTEDKSEIWIMKPDGSNRKKISEFEESVNSFEFSPAGDMIYFTAKVKLDESPIDIYPDLPLANVHMTEELMYRHWNRWHDYKFSHVFTAEYSERQLKNAKDIMEGEKYDVPMSPYFSGSDIIWSPCGKFIAYVCKKMSRNEYAVSTDSDIYLYNIKTGTTENLTQGMPGYDKYPVFSNNGEKIAWMSMETPGYESDKKRLFIMDLDTREKEYITEHFDYEVIDINWSADDKTIYFISGINATYQIFKIDITNRKIAQITDGVHNYSSIVLNDEFILANKMSMSMANEFFIVDLDGNERQLTFTNQHIYDNIEFGKVEERWVKTTDNKDMLVWLIYPPKFDENKEYPAFLYCQGGPQSAVSQFFSFRWNFQMMVAGDYIVIAPNRRGLPSFGTEWNAQISGDYGGQNMKDYRTAVEALKTEPFIDEDRIGAIGASYGGFSVFWLAGHNEDNLFKAFISHCGIFNFESMYNSTEELFFLNHDYGGAYWEKDNQIAQRSYANSPHNFVHKWNAPILIIAGQKDFRIPYTESLQAFNAAQIHGVPSKLLIFPEETHFVLKPQNSILWQREFRAWLDRWLKE
jgi:dipeptidyl aminopeptidase/acylaminoacyl peptidase